MKKLFYLVLLAVIAISCSKEENKEKETGVVKFSFTQAGLKSTLGTDTILCRSILISVSGETGKEVKSMEEINLFNFDGQYISEPVSFLTGNYQVTDFVVLDAEKNAVYASPKKDSPKAYLVQEPLPVSFAVSKDITSKLALEVLATAENKPEEFGYETFGFNISETFNFLLSVFSYDKQSENFVLTTGQLEILTEGNLIYSNLLNNNNGNGVTNNITLPEKFDNFTINIKKEGYTSFTKDFSKEELKKHFYSSDLGPLQIILSKSDTLGLIAYYPLNKNTYDYSGNNLHAQNFGASPAEDRFGMLNAYYFDSLSNYMRVKNSEILNPTNGITLSAWVKPSSFQGLGNTTVISKPYYYHESPYYQYHFGMTGDKYHSGAGEFCFALSVNSNYEYIRSNTHWEKDKWYHFVGTFDGNTMKIYVNGQLDAQRELHGEIDAYNTDVIIGQTINSIPNFYYGCMDDLRIYNRPLTSDEISAISSK